MKELPKAGGENSDLCSNPETKPEFLGAHGASGAVLERAPVRTHGPTVVWVQ